MTAPATERQPKTAALIRNTSDRSATARQRRASQTEFAPLSWAGAASGSFNGKLPNWNRLSLDSTGGGGGGCEPVLTNRPVTRALRSAGDASDVVNEEIGSRMNSIRNNGKKSPMLAFVLVGVVAAQLNAAEFSSLMAVFQDLNCPPSICPRWAAGDPCPTSTTILSCAGGSVTRLSLRDEKLNGTLSTSIGALTALQALSVFDNPALKGALHTHLGRLTQLRFL